MDNGGDGMVNGNDCCCDLKIHIGSLMCIWSDWVWFAQHIFSIACYWARLVYPTSRNESNAYGIAMMVMMMASGNNRASDSSSDHGSSDGMMTAVVEHSWFNLFIFPKPILQGGTTSDEKKSFKDRVGSRTPCERGLTDIVQLSLGRFYRRKVNPIRLKRMVNRNRHRLSHCQR